MKFSDRTSGIFTTARITVRPEKRRELFLTISSLLEQIRSEEGCRGYRFYGEESEQDSFLLVGEWETQSDLTRHIQSDHFSILRGSMEVLGEEHSVNFSILSLVGKLDEVDRHREPVEGT